MRNNKGQFIKGNKINLGKKNSLGHSFHPTVEMRKKMSCAQKGEKSHKWKGGISKHPDYRRKWKRRILENKASRPRSEQCEICGALGSDFKRGLYFDHDHNTGKFRGWICNRCNLALGLVKDNTETLEAMIKYLKDFIV